MALELLDPVGVCYGNNGDNLPPPSEAIALYKRHNVKKMRIFTPDEDVLRALKGANVELMLGILNCDLEKLQDPSSARIWVEKYVLDFWPDVKFRYIAVGDEVMPHERQDIIAVGDEVMPHERHLFSGAKFVFPAMKSIHNILSAHGIANQVKVSTTTDVRILGRSEPPSSGNFLDEASWFILPIIDFLKDINAPLLVSAHTYWSYFHTPEMSVSYALFTNALPAVKDRQYTYQNVFVAMLDAIYWALERANAPNLKIVVSATGWPSEWLEGSNLQECDHILHKYG